MRVTTHNARTGKHGVFSPKHNDRNFNISEINHISKFSGINVNSYWDCYNGYHIDSKTYETFEDIEKRFYTENFTEALNKQNKRYLDNRHKDRVKTMDEYRLSKQTCPEETILQIGKLDETVNSALLYSVVEEQMLWEQEMFPNVKYLNYAIHHDEQGAPHAHVRKVWVCRSKDGLAVSQQKALAEMGIERPNMAKPVSQYNNAKMTYTKRCREHFIELCKEKGLEIETEPLEPSQTGLELKEYKARQKNKQLTQLQTAVNEKQQELDRVTNELTEKKQELDNMCRDGDIIYRLRDEAKEECEEWKQKAMMSKNETKKSQKENEEWIERNKQEEIKYKEMHKRRIQEEAKAEAAKQEREEAEADYKRITGAKYKYRSEQLGQTISKMDNKSEWDKKMALFNETISKF